MDIEKEFVDIKTVIKDASVIARDFFLEDNTERDVKADGSVVTVVDKNIEAKLLAHIKERFPKDAIVGEEEGTHEGDSGFVWHIDPIDGTANFLRKIPFCCVSVARLGETAEDSFGLIYNPFTDQMFASLMEDGTYLNERVVKPEVYSLEGEKQAISISAGNKEAWMKPARYKLMVELGLKYGKATSYGSCALELAYIAANRIDAQICYGLNSYDYAAGFYLNKAAGAALSVFADGKWSPWESSIKELCSEHGRTTFVSHPDIHTELIEFIGDPKKWAS